MEQFFKDQRTLLRLRASYLGKFLDLFAAGLAELGYTRTTIRRKLETIVRFGNWLQARNVSVNEIGLEHVKEYLDQRWQRSTKGVPHSLERFVTHLAEQGIISLETTCKQRNSIDIAVESFACYLRQERGLYASTIRNYTEYSRRLLTAKFADHELNFSLLCAADVLDFVQWQASIVGRKRAKLMTSALRSFLQFLRYQGHINIDLQAAVPTVPNWSKVEIPRALPTAQVELVLSKCNRKTATGRRDYAILLLLARLGLRAGEVASLKLDDIDWEAGLVTVRSKGRAAQLPLPPDVGAAIASYLRDGRPEINTRALFLRVKAPIEGFEKQTTVGCLVKRALSKAGIDSPRKGAHQFRHSLATRMLSQGANLAQIGELLRHQNTQTTEIYAKVDFEALRPLAMEWPGGAK